MTSWLAKRAQPCTGKHHGYSPEDREALRARFDDWSMTATRERGAFLKRELMQALGVGSTMLKDDGWLLKPFFADGTLVKLHGRQQGYARTSALKSARLSDLVSLARDRVEGGLDVPRGKRRGALSDRIATSITPAQLAGIEGVANLIAGAITGDERRHDVVTGEHFRWLSAAGNGGAGEWEIVERVREWSDERSRWRAEAKGLAWRPEMNTGRTKHVGSTRLLLDLAATHGLIDRETRLPASAIVYPGEWVPEVTTWAERIILARDHKNGAKIRQGCRTLALYAHRSGARDLPTADWAAVCESIRRDRDRGAITYDIMTWARYVYRQLREEKIIDGGPWETAVGRRESLVPSRTAEAAAKTGDFSAWLTRAGTHPTPLVDGVYGIADWRTWALADAALDLELAKLPARTWPRPTAEQARKAMKCPSYFQLSQEIVVQRVQSLNHVAGWAETTRGIDWEKEDLTRLVDPVVIRAFGTHCAAKHTHGGPKKSSYAAQVAFAAATLASPYLEARALQEGDEETADRMQDYSNKLKQIALELKPPSPRKALADIESVWDNGSRRGGWRRLLQVRDAYIEMAERIAGMSIGDQIDAVSRGEFEATEGWAKAIRAAVLFTLLRIIPLRRRALLGLTFDMWQGKGGERWEGAILLKLPESLMKTPKAFAAHLMHPKNLGDARREALLRRDVLQLYFMAGGARDEILSIVKYSGAGQVKGKRVVVERKVYASSYIFPALVRRCGRADMEVRAKEGFAWDGDAFQAHFGKLILRVASRCGLDANLLHSTYNALAPHAVIRGLFGTFWAPRKLVMASRMLHHANTSVTERLYCGLSAVQVDLEDEEDELDQLAPRSRRRAAKRRRTTNLDVLLTALAEERERSRALQSQLEQILAAAKDKAA